MNEVQWNLDFTSFLSYVDPEDDGLDGLHEFSIVSVVDLVFQVRPAKGKVSTGRGKRNSHTLCILVQLPDVKSRFHCIKQIILQYSHQSQPDTAQP